MSTEGSKVERDEAARLTWLAEQAEEIGDQVQPPAAKHLYVAASLLRSQSEVHLRRYKGLDQEEAPGA